MYRTIQSAIDAINADPVPPSFDCRAVVMVWPGRYDIIVMITLPAYVTVMGATDREMVRLNFSGCNLFQFSGYNHVDSLYISPPNESRVVFVGGDTSYNRLKDLHITGGQSKLLTMAGTTFYDTQIWDIMCNMNVPSGPIIEAYNTSGERRNGGFLVTNLWSESYALTGIGGHIDLRQLDGTVVRNSYMGSGGPGGPEDGPNGRCIIVDQDGVPDGVFANINHCHLQASVPVSSAGTGAGYNLFCVVALGSTTSGWRNLYSASV